MGPNRFKRIEWTLELDTVVRDLMGQQPPATAATIGAKLNRQGFACSQRTVSRRMKVLREADGARTAEQQGAQASAQPSAEGSVPQDAPVNAEPLYLPCPDAVGRLAIDWVFPTLATRQLVRRVEG